MCIYTSIYIYVYGVCAVYTPLYSQIRTQGTIQVWKDGSIQRYIATSSGTAWPQVNSSGLKVGNRPDPRRTKMLQ